MKFIIALIYLLGSTLVAKPKSIGTYNFSCESLPGVTFSMPIFKDWEPEKKVTTPRPGVCRISLSWPDNIAYEEARSITVIKTAHPRYADLAKKLGDKKFKSDTQIYYPSQKNSHGVQHTKVFTYLNWVKGYEPRGDQYDYLEFFGPHYSIQVQILGGPEELGFFLTEMVDAIEKSFTFGE